MQDKLQIKQIHFDPYLSKPGFISSLSRKPLESSSSLPCPGGYSRWVGLPFRGASLTNLNTQAV